MDFAAPAVIVLPAGLLPLGNQPPFPYYFWVIWGDSRLKRIRVLLADDHTLIRAGIRVLLERAEDIEVVGEAGDGYEVLELTRRHKPDLVLLDIAMPKLSGFEVLERIRDEFPSLRRDYPQRS